jgi:hypothetical protein
MNNSLERWIAVYDFSAGRRLFALERVQHAARELGFQELVDHLEAALAHDRLTLHLDGHWNSRHRRRARPQSMVVDRMLAKALTGLRRAALLQAESAPPGDPIHEQVQTFLRAALPRGVFAVAMLPQVDELSVVTHLVQKLEGPLAETVAELGLGRQAARVAELARAFGQALRAAEQPKVSFREVQAARRRGQEYLLEAVAMILGRYYRCNDPEHAAARTALLSPIAQQSEAIRTYRRTRRSLKDVDPATGKETDTPSD